MKVYDVQTLASRIYMLTCELYNNLIMDSCVNDYKV